MNNAYSFCAFDMFLLPNRTFRLKLTQHTLHQDYKMETDWSGGCVLQNRFVCWSLSNRLQALASARWPNVPQGATKDYMCAVESHLSKLGSKCIGPLKLIILYSNPKLKIRPSNFIKKLLVKTKFVLKISIHIYNLK